jgi:hypothetical protein
MAAVGAPLPNIDTLTRSGLMMTLNYSQPSCTPSRAAFQTGRLPQRTGQIRPTAAGEKTQQDAGIQSMREGKKLLKELESLRNDLAHSQDINHSNWNAIITFSKRLEKNIDKNSS